eukprot:c54102_g1_i1.p2 GENE.c54102_g1_i1~~c54102_g1_i1.p2  ORF type:complete len:165 (+),score=27.07 c54102_g1_i1:80-574(+)
MRALATALLLLALASAAVAFGGLAVDASSTSSSPPGATELILAYRDTLNAAACSAWAGLFAPDGIKYDSPAPSVGTAELLAFCESHRVGLTAFAYDFVGPIEFTQSDGLRASVQWMLSATTGSAAEGYGAAVQSGYGSYVLAVNATSVYGWSIVTATGFNIVPL